MFEIADTIPNMGSMGHFQVSSTYESFETNEIFVKLRTSGLETLFEIAETNEIFVKLRTGQDLETGRVKKKTLALFSRYRCSR